MDALSAITLFYKNHKLVLIILCFNYDYLFDQFE